MQFCELSEEEYIAFSSDHPYMSFNQDYRWGKLKSHTGWQYYLLGVKEDDKIIGATMLLSKPIFLNNQMMYAPRGYLLDYNDWDLLKFFTYSIKEFAKRHHAIFVKIDPYVIAKERDIDGNVIPGGIDNTKAVEALKKLGYKHGGYTIGLDDLQPRWAFAIYLKGRSKEELFKNFEAKTRQMINKNERNGIYVRNIDTTQIHEFYEIMKHTAERRGFIERPESYYRDMVEEFKDNCKISIAELNLDHYLDGLNQQIKDLEKDNQNKQKDIDEGVKKINVRKTQNKINDNLNNIKRLNKKKTDGEALKAKHGSILKLGGIIFLIEKHEILSLFGGAYDEYMDFLSPYTTNWEMIKYAADNGFAKYNFYGISGKLNDKTDEMYGLYDFKRGFGGSVDEYLGEFDLIINKPLYRLYHQAFEMLMQRRLKRSHKKVK